MVCFGNMMKKMLFLLVLLLGACTNQTAQPLVLVATPQAADAGFQTYTHATGIFSIRIPPSWIPDELPDDNGVRMQFTAAEGSERAVRLSLMVVNTGQPLTAEAFIQAVNAYQPPADLSEIPWNPTSDPAAMPDGSVRLAGMREYPNLGKRGLNIFLQGNGSYFSALEVDVTDISPEALQTLMAVVNTFRIYANVPLHVGQVVQPGVTSASGILAFEDYLHWADQDGGFNITGRVLNTGDEPLEAVRLTAYLFDENGNQLAQRADVLPYDVLAGQEAAPFRLRFDTGRPSTAVRYELHAAARAAEFTLPTFYGGGNFLIGQDQAFYNSSGNLTINGLVQNSGDKLAKQVKIIAAVFNEQGRVVATESTFINKEELLPNEAFPFEITLYYLGGNAFRYVLVAQGRVE